VAAGSESISFLSTGIGGLEIADAAGSATAYSGKISGFGGSAHSNTSQYIELTGVTYSTGEMSSSYSGNATSGVLTVSSGGATVASIDFVGSYTSTNFQISSGSGGTVEITDPAVVGGGSVTQSSPEAFPHSGLDLPNVAFGARTTLAYSENAADTAGTLTVANGASVATIALLGNYIAASFATAADGHGGTLVTEMPQAAGPLQLTHPHA
jgi:hypothetical protein